MQDAAGAVSDRVTLYPEQTKEGELTITMTVDRDWLGESGRVYPVTLDPTVVTQTTRSAIDSTFITSGRPDANYSEKFELLIGKESSGYGNCRALFRISLPQLGLGDMVVSAKMSLIMYGAEFYASTTPDQEIDAHQITGPWQYGTVTWNSRPSIEAAVLDYAWIRRDDIAKEQYEKQFDITEAVKGWYEGTAENHGIMVMSHNEEGSYVSAGVKGYFWPERYNSSDTLYPRYYITYRNNKGLEDYWGYTTLGAGTAGVAHINDYTGNLVFLHGDVSTTGELLPITLQHVYNGYQGGTGYKGSYPCTGRGWKLSLQQTLLGSEKYGLGGQSLETYPYAYEDGDGTVHYFYKKTEDGSTVYLDEDGLGLELKISGSQKTITDKKGTILTFGAQGTLLYIQDAAGNKATISTKKLDDGVNQISRVTDGAGHEIRLAEKNSGTHWLETVTDPAGRTTTYSYSAYNSAGNMSLTRITYPDGTASTYGYDSEGSLTEARSADGSGLKISYTSRASGKQVSRVEELGKDGSVGQILTFDRTGHNTTVIRTAGSDDIYGNSDDLLTTCRFDHYGRTIMTDTRTASGTCFGGETGSYTAGSPDSTGSNIRSLNRITGHAYTGKSTRNLLKDHSGENGGTWKATYWLRDACTYTAKRTTEESCFGRYALQITSQSVTGDSGAAYYQKLEGDAAVPGNTYTYSGYIRTRDIRGEGADAGACLAVRIKKTTGTYERLYSDPVKGTVSDRYGNGWRRADITYTLPEDTESVNVYLLVKNATGTASYDGLQIETGNSPNSYNMLENPSFENKSGENAESWNLTGGEGDGVSTYRRINGDSSMKITGAAGEKRQAWQDLYVNSPEDEIYVYSGWAWARAVPDSSTEKRQFDLYALITYTDGSTKLKDTQGDFNRDVTGWQRTSMVFDLSDGDKDTERTASRIRVGVRYYRQANTAYFDHMQLLKDVADSYTYDSDGNLISAKENGEKRQTFGYDKNSNLTSILDSEDNRYRYEYNSAHQVTKATTPKGQTVSYTYGTGGTVLETTIANPSGTRKIQTGTTYSSASGGIREGAYRTGQSGQHGEMTGYSYDPQKGTLKSVATPDGTRTDYRYNDRDDRLESVSDGTGTVTYGYSASGRN